MTCEQTGDPPTRRSGSRHESRLSVEEVAPAIDTDSVEGAADVAAQQLRRRRAASWRCEALPDGRRDPWSGWPWPPYSVEASRKAWVHLADAGLMSELVDRILRGAA